jgi:predicted dehydrogenase
MVLRIGIIGCGKVAEQHVQAIHRIPGCEIVALCDLEPLMAKQLGERCGVTARFSDAREMLKSVELDVVHITTPPQSHYGLAKQCLESGKHVYLEKPFTITAGEAECLIRLSEKVGLKMTAGHNGQFTLEMIEMRRLVENGFLGGKPIHLESFFSYDLGEETYARALLGNRHHWVRQLPGQLLHNLLSHGIAKLAEFLDDDLTEIEIIADQSPLLRELGEQEIVDELRVLIRGKAGTSAFYCFSTQIKGLNELRVFGPSGSIVVDHSSGSLIRNPHRSYKSYLTYFIPPLVTAREHFRNAGMNIINFGRRKLYQDFGMKELIERFYNSIRLNGPPPIPYREILLTARIMDEIFDRIYPGRIQKSEISGSRSEVRPATDGFAVANASDRAAFARRYSDQ